MSSVRWGRLSKETLNWHLLRLSVSSVSIVNSVKIAGCGMHMHEVRVGWWSEAGHAANINTNNRNSIAIFQTLGFPRAASDNRSVWILLYSRLSGLGWIRIVGVDGFWFATCFIAKVS